MIMKLDTAMQTLHFQLDEILNVMILGKQGIISPEILDSDEFLENYAKIIGNRMYNTAISAKTEHFQFILDISDLQIFTIGDKIFFKIIVPLVPNAEWNILQIYPIPSKRNGVFFAPVVEHQIYLTSGLLFMNTDIEYLNKLCKNQAGTTICKQTLPIHDRNSKTDCRSEIINFKPHIEHCQITVLKIEDISFIPLKTSNCYIAIPANPIEIDTICQTKHTLQKLDKPSITRANTSCDILYKAEHMRIGETKNEVKYEIKTKTLALKTNDSFTHLLDKLQRAPKNRRLTDAEVKVQKSIQKLSVPDWYAKKRSKPPKILNAMPIEYRVPLWKRLTLRRKRTSNSSSSESTGICYISPHVKENVKEKTKKATPPTTSNKKKNCQQMLSETKNTRSPTKSSSSKEEILDLDTPVMKFPRKIPKTFPEISPSRKIHNINIVLPPAPKIVLSKEIEDMCNDDYSSDESKETSVLKERPFNVDRTTKIEDFRNADVIIHAERDNRQKKVRFQDSQAVTTLLKTLEKPNIVKDDAISTPTSSQTSEVETTPLSTPEVEPKLFRYRAKSTPTSSQTSEVETTPSSTPDGKPQFIDLRANSIPELSQASEVETTPLSTPNMESKLFTYRAKPTPTSSQTSEVETTPSSAPDIRPKFIDLRGCSILELFQASEVETTPLSTPDIRPKFIDLRANSIPKRSQAAEVATTSSSTPGGKKKFVKLCAISIPQRSQASKVVTTPLYTPDGKPKFIDLRANSTPKLSHKASKFMTSLNTPVVKPKFFTLRANSTPKFSQSRLRLSSIIEDKPKERILSPSILERSLIFENKSINSSSKSENIRRSKKISPNLLEKTFIFENRSTHNNCQESSNSTDSVVPLRSKQLNRKKNIVQEIVRELDENMRKSLQPHHSQDDKENFVKQIVNALENGDISKMRSLSGSSMNDEDSPSETETKFCVASPTSTNSPKDTDYSDYSRKSTTLNSDVDQPLSFEHFKDGTLKDEDEEKKKKDAEDDSVHWISILKCTLSRSSSPLSMFSKLPGDDQSPCISPIKSPNEVEYSLRTSWGATYKTSNRLIKKLFRETAVIDSGYSD
ncbi:uncharacterized protein LOC132916032 [Bombus pascuorum]|uniref:uncharacterized protein LOC132916032 n=1 Tax=Bombus pascuorum TaxID=65598 RepID=UPI00298E7B98|nr:uncharacterized protein LOC132916032 [Bombus pascuorum]